MGGCQAVQKQRKRRTLHRLTVIVSGSSVGGGDGGAVGAVA